ncbi:MAG: glycoside hydrolase/phage tail family protein [Pseudomonadota bacterium]
MAALILTTAATAAASSFGLNAAVTAGLTATAAIAGRLIDQALLARPTNAEGPRLDTLDVTSSAEGTPIKRVYGRIKVGGDVIWATHLEEVKTKTKNKRGGKGGRSSSSTTTTTYSYYANFAAAICEGPVSHLGRIWIDGEEADLSEIDYRFYDGRDSQQPDPLIEAKEGAGSAPAYRDVAYVVFERLPLEEYGNRIPQVSFEVYRSVGGLETKLKAVDIIPGAGEFSYDTKRVRRTLDRARYLSENRTSRRGESDFSVALNELTEVCPNVEAAALIVTWFGTDLRAGHCKIEPRVDQSSKTLSEEWSVAGLSRSNANVVSQYNGGPAFGGTPDDASVIRAIWDMQARGLDVFFYPFIMMDIPASNALPNPYGGAAQAAYPWRGRVTCNPAIGFVGSADQTADAAAQISSFVGTALASHFAVSGSTITYSGPNEWSFRRHILHAAALCKAAGGVDRFVIGSEMVGLTRVRDENGNFPFVDALKTLAADVRQLLGPGTKVSYAADWSEYHSYRPADGSGDVFFNLDPLWADSNIDFIGIDAYFPVTDWRDGYGHLDAVANPSAAGVYDRDVLKAGIEGGEYFDWYYASSLDRRDQFRTPITDGAYGKPWVFRQKDLKSWWSNAHIDRVGGVETASTTAWTPQRKPIVFTEVGCPAVDKGSNQPNVFYDPKSSESFFPHFSSGARDDHIQRRFLETVIDYWSLAAGNNPTSPHYGGPMIDPDRMFIWAFDARAFPAFPADNHHWRDALNWDRGHWINARAGAAPLDGLVSTIVSDAGAPPCNIANVSGHMDGYSIDRVMSVRDAIDPLEHAFGLSPLDREGELVVLGTDNPTAMSLNGDDLVPVDGEDDAEATLTWTRSDPASLPGTARITLREPFADLDSITVEANHPDGGFHRTSSSTIPGAMAPEIARGLAESWLYRAHVRRDQVQFTLPPSYAALEPGDVIEISGQGTTDLVQVEEIADDIVRNVRAVRYDPALRLTSNVEREGRQVTVNTATGVPDLLFLDLPMLQESSSSTDLYFAAQVDPWHNGIAVYSSPEDDGFEQVTTLDAPSTMGALLTELPPGVPGRRDRSSFVDVEIDGNELASVTNLQLFDGANAFAVAHDNGEWEILQAQTIELISTGVYRLSNFLRGQLGTDFLTETSVSSGARIVALDEDLTAVDVGSDHVRLPTNWRYGLAGRAFSDPSFETRAHTPKGIGERPYRPAHLRSLVKANGDIDLSWVRRTRAGGDSWDQVEVPLSETSEAYSIAIKEGSSVVRTLQTSASNAVYSAADQAADFPSGRPEIGVDVSQLSDRFGAGPAATLTIPA